MPLPGSKRKGNGLRSSASSSSSLTSSTRISDLKRRSLDLNTNAMTATRSGPIPRGDGHRAMSIPMPPPSVYFSLLPPNSGNSSGAGNGGTSTGSHSSNKDNGDRTLSRSASAKGRQPRPKQLHPHSDPTPLHNSNLSGHSPSRSAASSRPPSGPSTPGGGGAIPIGSAGVHNHYHTHHHAPRSTYPLSMTHSRRSSVSHPSGTNTKQG